MKIILLCLLILVPLMLSAEDNKFTYDAKNKRDPFLPLVTETGQILDLEPKETTTLNLEGIIFDRNNKNESLAAINGVVLKKGQALNDYLVFDIGEKEVTLIKGSEKIILHLNKE